MKKMSAAAVCSLALIACGQASHADEEADRDNRVFSNGPEVKVSVSKNEEYWLNEQLGFSLSVMPVLDHDQYPSFNAEKKEGMLSFALVNLWNRSGRYGGQGKRLSYCQDDAYLFTKIDQRKDFIDGQFGETEPKIYLRKNKQVIEVGSYFKTHPGESDFKRFDRWMHPQLCEGAYAGVCRVSVSMKGEGYEVGEKLQAAVRVFLLEPEGESEAFILTTATTSKKPSFEYFSCDEIINN